MKYWSILLVLFLLSTSCKKKEKVDYETSFFDISQYVDSLLQVKSTSVINREINLNGKKEKVKLESNDLTEIFEFLKQFNINRPKWYDKYDVNRYKNEVSYHTTDENLDIKELTVVYNTQNKVEEINILYKSHTLISNTQKKVVWRPTERLEYNNISGTLWSNPDDVDISWTYSL